MCVCVCAGEVLAGLVPSSFTRGFPPSCELPANLLSLVTVLPDTHIHRHTYIHTHTHKHTHTHARIHTEEYKHTHTHTLSVLRMHARTCSPYVSLTNGHTTSSHTHTHTQTHSHSHMLLLTHTHTHTHTRPCETLVSLETCRRNETAQSRDRERMRQT